MAMDIDSLTAEMDGHVVRLGIERRGLRNPRNFLLGALPFQVVSSNPSY
jgi:hypothetical protein